MKIEKYLHSPGPWRYTQDDQCVYAKSMRGDKGEFMVADVRGWGHLQYVEGSEGIQDANGKLLASGPDLVIALERISNCTDIATAREYARDALKKATS